MILVKKKNRKKPNIDSTAACLHYSAMMRNLMDCISDWMTHIQIAAALVSLHKNSLLRLCL